MTLRELVLEMNKQILDRGYDSKYELSITSYNIGAYKAEIFNRYEAPRYMKVIITDGETELIFSNFVIKRCKNKKTGRMMIKGIVMDGDPFQQLEREMEAILDGERSYQRSCKARAIEVEEAKKRAKQESKELFEYTMKQYGIGIVAFEEMLRHYKGAGLDD